MRAIPFLPSTACTWARSSSYLRSNPESTTSSTRLQLVRMDPRMKQLHQSATVHQHVDIEGLRSVSICGNFITCGE